MASVGTKPRAKSKQQSDPRTSWRSALLAPLARQVLLARVGDRGLVVGITSAVNGEGTTTVAWELARELVQTGQLEQPILFLDCGGEGQALLTSQYEAGEAARLLGDEPALVYHSLFGSQSAISTVSKAGLGAAFDDLRRRYAFVVLDLPPVLNDSATREIAREVDRLYLVIRAGATHEQWVERALKEIGSERVTGVILNDARSNLPKWLTRLVH